MLERKRILNYAFDVQMLPDELVSTRGYEVNYKRLPKAWGKSLPDWVSSVEYIDNIPYKVHNENGCVVNLWTFTEEFTIEKYMSSVNQNKDEVKNKIEQLVPQIVSVVGTQSSKEINRLNATVSAIEEYDPIFFEDTDSVTIDLPFGLDGSNRQNNIAVDHYRQLYQASKRHKERIEELEKEPNSMSVERIKCLIDNGEIVDINIRKNHRGHYYVHIATSIMKVTGNGNTYFPLGPFSVEILPDTVRVLPLNDTTPMNGSYCHPHVSSNGSLCLGDYYDMYHEFINNSEFDKLVYMVMDLLRTYNVNSPYTGIENISPNEYPL